MDFKLTSDYYPTGDQPEAIKQLIEEDEKPKKKIGYLKESQAKYGKSRRKNWISIKISKLS